MTPQQTKLLSFLKSESARGNSPSFDEMAVALRLRSKSCVYRIINALEERGFITRLPHRARSIIVRDDPEYRRGYRDGYEAGLANALGLPTSKGVP